MLSIKLHRACTFARCLYIFKSKSNTKFPSSFRVIHNTKQKKKKGQVLGNSRMHYIHAYTFLHTHKQTHTISGGNVIIFTHLTLANQEVRSLANVEDIWHIMPMSMPQFCLRLSTYFCSAVQSKYYGGFIMLKAKWLFSLNKADFQNRIMSHTVDGFESIWIIHDNHFSGTDLTLRGYFPHVSLKSFCNQ